MKSFHIGDILSVTTGLLVSPDHIGGVYAILNFLTGDNLFTHQLPRAMKECEPWLRAQFPKLMPDDPIVTEQMRLLSESEDKQAAVVTFCDNIKESHGLPEVIPVYELPKGWHLNMDPLMELEAMVGKDKIIAVQC